MAPTAGLHLFPLLLRQILLLLFSILASVSFEMTSDTGHLHRLRVVNDSTWKPGQNLQLQVQSSFNGTVTAISARGRQNLRLSSMFETGLFSILRMDSRPRRRTRETVIPKLMMDLYLKRAAHHSPRPKTNRMRSRVHDDQSEAAAADVIRSFFARGEPNLLVIIRPTKGLK